MDRRQPSPRMGNLGREVTNGLTEGGGASGRDGPYQTGVVRADTPLKGHLGETEEGPRIPEVVLQILLQHILLRTFVGSSKE